jgi:Mrp family chromosome partitioning ATPase
MCESASKDDVAATLAHFREQFDVVVVDAARLTESSIGVLFARMCDAVILTARKGRSVRKNDRATAETVEREGAKLLGIVTVAPEAIRSAKRRPLGSKQNIGSVVYRTTPTMESVVASRIG